MQMKVNHGKRADFLETGKLGQLFEAAQAAAKRYQENVSNFGISIKRKWEAVC